MAKNLTSILSKMVIGGAMFLPSAYAQEPAQDIPAPIRAVGIPENIQDSVICLRNTTIRETPTYDPKGNFVLVKESSQSFGTGFVYMEKEGYCYIVTNTHVSCDDDMYEGKKRSGILSRLLKISLTKILLMT